MHSRKGPALQKKMMMNENEQYAAFEEGYYAFQRGKKWKDNPYWKLNEEDYYSLESMTLALKWDDGYTYAMIERERNFY